MGGHRVRKIKTGSRAVGRPQVAGAYVDFPPTSKGVQFREKHPRLKLTRLNPALASPERLARRIEHTGRRCIDRERSLPLQRHGSEFWRAINPCG